MEENNCSRWYSKSREFSLHILRTGILLLLVCSFYRQLRHQPERRELLPKTIDPKTVEIKEQEYNFYAKVHTSENPAEAAGNWINDPNQAFHYSNDHLKCLEHHNIGNCHDQRLWKKSREKTVKARHIRMKLGSVMNSPGILAASDPWVWGSNLPQYEVMPFLKNDTSSYQERVLSALNNVGTIYLAGDSLTRMWHRVMTCELVHVIGMSPEKALEKVQFSSGYEPYKFPKFGHLSKKDIVVINFGHFIGWKAGKDWQKKYAYFVNAVRQIMDFGPIPDRNLYFRSTSVRHFHKGGDYMDMSSRAGGKLPDMNAQWDNFGGNQPDLPMQNLLAFEGFLGPQPSGHNFQILDTSPMMLARADATFDGTHFCMPGPVEFWSRMLYRRLEVEHAA